MTSGKSFRIGVVTATMLPTDVYTRIYTTSSGMALNQSIKKSSEGGKRELSRIVLHLKAQKMNNLKINKMKSKVRIQVMSSKQIHQENQLAVPAAVKMKKIQMDRMKLPRPKTTQAKTHLIKMVR